MKHHLYTLPIAGAAPLAISATQPTRRVEIIENDAAATQGIILFYPDDNYTQGYTIAPAYQPAILGNLVSAGKGAGPIVGYPAQVVSGKATVPATIMVKATSATATATSVRVTEYD